MTGPTPERVDRYARALYSADWPRGIWERRPPEVHEAYRVRARAAITEADTEREQRAPTEPAVRPSGVSGGGVAALESPEGGNGVQAGAHGLQGAEVRRRAAHAMTRLWRDTNGAATFDQLAAAALAAVDTTAPASPHGS